MYSRGSLIVLEGCDRVGKSTQAKLLVESLQKQGRKAKLMNFPDRTSPIGSILNQYLKQDQDLDDHAVHLLFSANRWEAVSKMEQQLKAGTTLVVDRYSDSGVAYSAAKGVDLTWCQSSDAGLPKPDLVLYLTLSAEQSQLRGGYGQERFEKQNFQLIVKDNYKKLTQDYWKVVCAEDRSVEELQAELLALCVATIDTATSTPIGKLYTSECPVAAESPAATETRSSVESESDSPEER